MKVLLVNDDGPPAEPSPFILPWYKTLKAFHPNWDLSVVIPDSQKSWISKAFHIGDKITAKFYNPETQSTFSTQQSSDDWLLLDGTPSSCANIGLYHLSGDKPFDLLISGPNFGRNSSTVYTLGSGTIGAAMEAALSGYKSIALSFAIFDKLWTEKEVVEACMLSSRVIDHLLRIWAPEVEVYNINIPLIQNVLQTKIYFTRLLENRSGSLFRLLNPAENYLYEREGMKMNDANVMEEKLREEGKTDEVDGRSNSDILEMQGIKRWQWSVDFKGLEAFTAKHGTKGGGMTDGWCISQRWGSVTALRASFQVVDGGAGSTHGGEELILD